MLKPKNIVILAVIILILILIYIFFMRGTPEQASLVSIPATPTDAPLTSPSATSPAGTQDFLSLLLNIKNIKLDDSIFADVAFTTLRDSSIVLTPLGTEGRPNPFAPIGTDAAPSSSTQPRAQTQTQSPATSATSQ